ncbi:ricin-type beta-trefoil lectin domain protein [Lentzea sp. JNUCC 0626]|uniref:RICIN domain-containing protein n=1 Tax=Lentzea sp. JNUCC 0626 TaxID=3367513 RepID=UPI0037491A84
MLFRLVGSVAAAALVLTAAPVAAIAAPQAEALYWIRFAGEFQHCLDANFEGAVYTHACQDRNDHQKWDNYTPGKFRNKKTKQCLAGGRTSVFTTSCDVAESDWRTSSGTKKRFTHVSTGLCLHNQGGHGQAAGLRACVSGTAYWTTTLLRS